MTVERKVSFCKLGSICSIVAGLSYLIIAFMGFRIPESVTSFVASDSFFNEFQIYKLHFYNLKFLTILANLSMIGVVCSYMSLCRDKYVGIVSFSSILAIIGYSFGFYHSFIDMSFIPNLANQYLTAPTTIRDVIIAFGISNPMLYLVTHGLPGIWFLLVSTIGITNKKIPKFLILLGFLWGIGNLITAFSHIFQLTTILYFVSMQVLIFAPLWGFSEGFYLLYLIKIITDEDRLLNT
jgi:hypothetical protein